MTWGTWAWRELLTLSGPDSFAQKCHHLWKRRLRYVRDVNIGKRSQKAAELWNIKTTRLLELVCMDFLSLEADKSNTKVILFNTDHSTKYVAPVPTRNQEGKVEYRF